MIIICAGLAIFAITLPGLYSATGHFRIPTGENLLFIGPLFIVSLGVLAFGFIKMFQKSRVRFSGVRTTDSGFEAGTLTVNATSVEPKVKFWQEASSGRILTGTWVPSLKISGSSLSLMVFLREDRSQHYFFERFVIASDKSVLYQLTGTTGATSMARGPNNLVAVVEGSFQLLGDRTRYQNLLPLLEQVRNVLSTSAPHSPPPCTLNFLAKTTDLAIALPYGIAGVLIAKGIDAHRRRKLKETFEKDQLFDADFTRNLMEFLTKHGWGLTVNGE
jgi:hypothetical protein